MVGGSCLMHDPESIVQMKPVDPESQSATETCQSSVIGNQQFTTQPMVIGDSNAEAFGFAKQKFTTEDEVTECIVHTLRKRVFRLCLLPREQDLRSQIRVIIPDIPAMQGMGSDGKPKGQIFEPLANPDGRVEWQFFPVPAISKSGQLATDILEDNTYAYLGLRVFIV